jgi:hypothetical protein
MLCHGAHDLEDCPSYRGDTSLTDGEGSPGPSQNGDSPLFSKSTNVIQLGKSNLGREHVFCENCAVSLGGKSLLTVWRLMTLLFHRHQHTERKTAL